MGVLAGTMSYKAYYVEGYDPMGVEFSEWFEIFKKNTFKEIETERGEKESFGFVDSRDLFSTELIFEHMFIDNYIYLNFRRDTIKLQKSVLERYAREIMEKFFQNKKMTKQLKKEINTRAEAKYIKQVFPTINSYEAVWNVETKILYFFNQSGAINEKFSEIFSRLMNVELIELETATFAASFLDEKELDIFESTSPSALILDDEIIRGE
jgi:hypothetical protein